MLLQRYDLTIFSISYFTIAVSRRDIPLVWVRKTFEFWSPERYLGLCYRRIHPIEVSPFRILRQGEAAADIRQAAWNGGAGYRCWKVALLCGVVRRGWKQGAAREKRHWSLREWRGEAKLGHERSRVRRKRRCRTSEGDNEVKET